MAACQNCGGVEFNATQSCAGTVPVIVTVNNGVPFFLRNATPDNHIDTNDLEWDNPQGPFICRQCGQALPPCNSIPS